MFKEFIGHWTRHVDQRVDLSPSTKVTYTRVATHLAAWDPAPGPHNDRVDLSSYVVERRAEGIAPRTIALELRIAGAAFRWAQEAGLVEPSVQLDVPRVRVDPRVFVLNHRTPTPSEAARVFEAMPFDDWRLAVVLLARTGARVGEVVRLRSCDLDEDAGMLALGRVEGASKSGMRWFPLDSSSLSDLAGRSGRGEAPLLDFAAVTAPIQAIGRRLRRACSAAGVPEFSPHGLRRMVVGRLLRAQVDPGTAATLTGHTVEVMLKFYQEVSDEDRRVAAAQANLGSLECQNIVVEGHHQDAGRWAPVTGRPVAHVARRRRAPTTRSKS